MSEINPESTFSGKRKASHSELFTLGPFEKKDLPSEHQMAKTHVIFFLYNSSSSLLFM